MLKKIGLILIALVFLAGSAYANDNFNLSGSFSFQGRNLSHSYEPNGASKTEWNDSYYDQDLQLYTNFKVSDSTKVIAQWAIYDKALGGRDEYASDNRDADVTVERCYLESKKDFGNIYLGIMDGGTWGTVFGDTLSARNRIKYTKAINGVGTFVGVLEKNADKEGSKTSNTSNSEDISSYYLGFITKAGNINIKPLFAHTVYGAGNYEAKETFLLAADGTFGNISFEAELIKVNAAKRTAANDLNTLGFYINGWTEIGPAKYGVVYAFGSADEKDGTFGFGEDFDDDLAIIDEGNFRDTTACQISGVDFIKLYANYKVSDALSFSANAAYLTSKLSDDDFKGTEVNINGSYAIDEDLTYSFGVASANFEDYSTTVDKTDYNVTKLYHNISIAF